MKQEFPTARAPAKPSSIMTLWLVSNTSRRLPVLHQPFHLVPAGSSFGSEATEVARPARPIDQKLCSEKCNDRDERHTKPTNTIVLYPLKFWIVPDRDRNIFSVHY